jgi:hypothetical protein
MHHLTHLSEEQHQCIENCTTCHEVCLSMAATHCLKLGGKHAEQAHFRLMMDCAEICATSANFMLRGSPLHQLTCGVCAEVCAQCADSCAQVGDMDECVDACRACAESCGKMAA